MSSAISLELDGCLTLSNNTKRGAPAVLMASCQCPTILMANYNILLF